MRRLTWSPDGLLCAAPSGEINPAPLPLNKEDQKENIIEERTEIEKSQVKIKNDPFYEFFLIFYAVSKLKIPAFVA